MSENKDENNNILDLDDIKIKKLHAKGNYFGIFERFDYLRVKFMYDTLEPDEAREFILLTKYLMQYGHSEAVKLSCHYIHKKYMEKQGL